MTDYKILITVIVFLGSFIYLQTMLNTEVMNYDTTYSGNYTYNGTIYSNLTGRSGGQAIPMPPECNIELSLTIIPDALGCGAGWMGYFWGILTFESSTAWLNILIIVPLLVAFALFCILLLIRLLDLIPFT